MFRFISLLIVFSFLPTLLLAQAPTIQMQRSLGSQGPEGGSSIITTIDGGYVVAGVTTESGNGDSLGDVTGTKGGGRNLWVVKLNNGGVIQWQALLGGSLNEEAASIRPTADGGYIVAGYTNSPDGDVAGLHVYGQQTYPYNAADMWVIKLSNTGSVQWQKCLGGYKDDYGYSVETLSDGNFIVVGWSQSVDGNITLNHGKKDAFLVKLSSQGTIIWSKTLGGSDDDIAWFVKATSNGGCIVIGSSQSSDGDFVGPTGTLGQWIIKINSEGAIEWKRNSFGYTLAIDLTSDGGYVLAGSKGQPGKSQSDMWLAKVKSTGELEWERYYGGSAYDVATSVKVASDGSFYLAGYTYSGDGDVTGYHGTSNNNQSDMWVIKAGPNGELKWQKCLGGSQQDMAAIEIGTLSNKGEIQIGLDGGVVVVGHTYSSDGDVVGNHTGGFYTVDDADMWLIKLSPEITVQHFHQLVTNINFSSRKLLAIIPSSTSFKVCADGSQASIFKFAGGGLNYNQATLSVPNDIAKYGAFSLITQVADSLVVRYQHPTLLDPTAAFFMFTATLTIPGSQSIQFSITVQRAPVMMIHGLWADSSSFAKMESDLLSTGLYTSDFLMRANYKSTNFVSFNQNKTVVPDNITALITKLRAKGIAAGGVDIAGHSMGGILSRLYLQSSAYRHDVHKLITINTPHSGAQMANLLLDATQATLGTRSTAFVACLTIGQLFNNVICNGGAIDDLRVDSPAIRNDLNGSTLRNNPVPSHTIVTIENPTADVDLNTDKFALVDKTYMAKLLFRDVLEGGFNVIFNPDIEDDIIVAASSQKGGLSGAATSLVHNQIHMGSPANPDVITVVKTLLSADPNGESFAHTGFNPVQLTYQPQWRKFTSGGRKVATSSDAAITISSPKRGSYWRPGVSVPVSSSGTGFSYIKTVLQYNNDSIYVAERTTPTTTYTALLGRSLGMHKIVVIGQTPAGEMITDSSYFYVTSSLCESRQSGDWRNPYTWSCNREPTLADVVVINPGHTITITSNNAQAQRIIYSGGNILFTSNSKVFVNSN